MQWLIDIIAEAVIAAIGIPPVFIDRGDPAAVDFVSGDFIKDQIWRDLDLSAIVPENAQAATLFVVFRASSASRVFALRKKGQNNSFNIAQLMTQVGNLYITSDLLVAVDSNRKIQYNINNGTINTLNVTVKGWWL